MSDEEIRRRALEDILRDFVCLFRGDFENPGLELYGIVGTRIAPGGEYLNKLLERTEAALAAAPASPAPAPENVDYDAPEPCFKCGSTEKPHKGRRVRICPNCYDSPAPALTGDKLKEIANRHGSLSRGYFLIFDWDAIVQDREFPR